MKPKLVLVVCGTRTFNDFGLVVKTLDHLTRDFDVQEVVHGAAAGADTLADQWAQYRTLPRKRFHSDWKEHGKKAGVLRNQDMVDYAAPLEGRLVAFWDGNSRGTADMIARARKAGMKVKVVAVNV